MITCPNCDGAGHLLSMSVARIRKRGPAAFVECPACLGTKVFPPGQMAPEEIRIHKLKIKKK